MPEGLRGALEAARERSGQPPPSAQPPGTGTAASPPRPSPSRLLRVLGPARSTGHCYGSPVPFCPLIEVTT